MDVYRMKKLLRTIKPERVRMSPNVRMKIEKIHNVQPQEVLENLQNPDNLVFMEQQPSRAPHDETYGLVFEKSKSRRLFIVVTYKALEKIIFIVTAYSTSKKLERLIKRQKIRRNHG